MNVLEKEIEDIIWEASGIQLIERGLEVKLGSLKWRQLHLGSYGIADMVTVRLVKRVDKLNGNTWVLLVDVFELKKEEINVNTYLQALEYCKGLERFFSTINTISHTCEFKIILIGKKIDTSSSFCYMADFCSNLDLYTYKIDLEKGVRFHKALGFHENEGDEYFPSSLYNEFNIATGKRILENKKVETKQWINL